MFMLGICYLNGWAMAAADGARKEQPEWPPHPDRVFMALAAAWFETGENSKEGDALRWLEALPPPSIAASRATARSVVTHYVPVNDMNGKARLSLLPDLSLLPEHREQLKKQLMPRGFPVAIPEDPTVYLIWPKTKLNTHRASLECLTHKVTHIGHSASFVQVWLEDNKRVAATLEPQDGIVKHRLRIPMTGRLDELARTCNRSKVLEYMDLKARVNNSRGQERRLLRETMTQRFGKQAPVSRHPVPCRWQGYGQPQTPEPSETPSSIFNPQLIVLALKRAQVSLPATLKLTQALRGTLLRSCSEQPPPEWFSGHRPDGTPTTEPHMAILPLPFVGGPHANGRIMGLALALPRGLKQQDISRSLNRFLYDADTGLPRESYLFDGLWLECAIALDDRERPPMNLLADTWVQASRIWASVTPVVLNRHFDGRNKWKQAVDSVKDACQHVGLPCPREVLLHPVSLVEGVPHAREYPRLMRKSDGGMRAHTHAIIIFDEQVCGPVTVGAGRFRGYGFCRPVLTRC